MIMSEYDQIIREHFNISDDRTRKYIVSLKEDAEQTQLLAALSSALYDKIVKNVDKIDFGSIPRSRGDITKVDGYENTMECLNIMRRLVLEYRENPIVVDTVLAAAENIKSRKGIFMKAFSLNSEFPTVLYNLIVLSIEQCVSFLISVCIQYIKDPATQSMSSALDKVAYNNTRDNLLYEQLSDFNKACMGSTMNDLLDKVIKNGGKLNEDVELATWGDPLAKSTNINVTIVPQEDPNNQVDVEKDIGMKPMDRMPEADEQLPIHGCGDQPSANNGAVNEFGIATGIAIGATALIGTWLSFKLLRYLVKVLIPTMRKITYYMISIRVKLSDCISVQADFIQANAYKLQYSTTSDLSEEKKKKVIEKQLRIAEKMKAIANKFAIENKKAEKSANQMASEDEKEGKRVDNDGNIF